MISSPRDLRAGVRERGQRPQGIVQLMTQYANELFPSRYLLAGQLSGQQFQQIQPKRASLQDKRTLRQVKRLFDSVDLRGKQAVAQSRGRAAQSDRGPGQRVLESRTLKTASLAQQVPRRNVGIGDAIV